MPNKAGILASIDQMEADLAALQAEIAANCLGDVMPAPDPNPDPPPDPGLTTDPDPFPQPDTATGALPADVRLAEYRYRPDNTPTSAWLDLEWNGFDNPGSIA